MTPRMWTKRMWTQNCWFSIYGLDYWGKREERGLNLLINSKRPLGIIYKSRLLGAIVTTQATVILLKLYHFSFKVEIKGQHFVETSLKLSVVTAGKLASYTGEIPTRGKKKNFWHGTSPHVGCLLLWRAESLLLDSTLNDCGGRKASVSFWTGSWTCYTIPVSLFLLRASCLIPNVLDIKQ